MSRCVLRLKTGAFELFFSERSEYMLFAFWILLGYLLGNLI
jgi:hypothetical protein